MGDYLGFIFRFSIIVVTTVIKVCSGQPQPLGFLQINHYLYQNAVFIPQKFLVCQQFRSGYDVHLNRLTATCAVYRKVISD